VPDDTAGYAAAAGREAARAAGMAVRRKVLGDKHVDAAIAKSDSFTADFQDLITRYAWGEIWNRPGLDEPVRRYLTIAMLACLGRDEELAMHVRAAAEGGVTADEIKEVLLQVAIYGGVPAANRAFAIAQQVLRDAGEEHAAPGTSAVPGTSGTSATPSTSAAPSTSGAPGSPGAPDAPGSPGGRGTDSARDGAGRDTG